VFGDRWEEGPERFLDPDVVEAACLAHDLGHPPFGHVAEEELDHLSRDVGGAGFEGNAQSFRIVTHSAIRGIGDLGGLNLTRATLSAVLKYPWFRDSTESPKSGKKFGAYQSDRAAFDFARAAFPDQTTAPERRSLEAQVMDHADAIAYAVHDLTDFYRAGLIPLGHLMNEGLEDFFECHEAKIMEDVGGQISSSDAIKHLRETIEGAEPYEGTRQQQMILKAQASGMINRYIASPAVDWSGDNPVLRIPPLHTLEINFLKSIIWHYVINRPHLGTQQHGMKRIIRTLFNTYHDTITASEKKSDARIIPQMMRPAFKSVRDGLAAGESNGQAQVRLAVDIVASLADGQALELYRRLEGIDPGKITDLIAQ